MKTETKSAQKILRPGVFYCGDDGGLACTYPTEAWLIAFVGPKGSGKTLTMTERAAYAMAMFNMPVWSNYRIAFDFIDKNGKTKHCESLPLDMRALYSLQGDIQSGVLIIDELPFYLESRRSGSTRNLVVGYGLMQCRKRKLSFLYSAQNEQWIDSRIRWSTDVVCECRDASRSPEGQAAGYERGEVIDITLWDNSGMWSGVDASEKYREPVNEYSFWGKALWGAYDTGEMIDLFEAMRGVEVMSDKYQIGDGGGRRERWDALERMSHEVVTSLVSSGLKEIDTTKLFEAVGARENEEMQVGRYLKKLGLTRRQVANGSHRYVLPTLAQGSEK